MVFTPNNLRARLEPTEEPVTKKLWPNSDKQDVVIYNSAWKPLRRFFWFEPDKPAFGERVFTLNGEKFKLRWAGGK